MNNKLKSLLKTKSIHQYSNEDVSRLEDFYINEREFYKREIERAKIKCRNKTILTIILNLMIITLYVIGLIIMLKWKVKICKKINK